MKQFGGWRYLKNKIFEMPRDNTFSEVICARAEMHKHDEEEKRKRRLQQVKEAQERKKWKKLAKDCTDKK